MNVICSSPARVKAIVPASTMNQFWIDHSLSIYPIMGFLHTASFSSCHGKHSSQGSNCLKLRLQEHCHALRNGDVAASAIAEHTLTTGHGPYQVNESGLPPTHHHKMPLGTRHPEKHWQPQQGTRNTPRGLRGSFRLTKSSGTILVSLQLRMHINQFEGFWSCRH